MVPALKLKALLSQALLFRRTSAAARQNILPLLLPSMEVAMQSKFERS